MAERLYKVNEIFYSLQGEGRNAGRAALFLRLSGCNLRCPFCDTDFTSYQTMSMSDIIARMQELSLQCRFIVITGGEPTLQVDEEMILALHNAGYTLAMETNGTNTVPEGIDFITISPKNIFVNGARLVPNRCDELKVIYDGEHEVSDFGLKPTYRFLQPCDTGDKARNSKILQSCIEYIKLHPEWQLSLQQHKIIGIQ